MAHALGVSSQRALVIDDDRDVTLAVAQALRVCGCVVEVAGGGEEGLRKARSFRPDVIFCDLAMPGMDGLAVAAAVRADPDLCHVRLVAFTGNREFTEAAARDAGFDDLLLKPGRLACIAAVLERGAA